MKTWFFTGMKDHRSYVPVSGGFENKVPMVEKKIRNRNRTEQSTIQVVIKQVISKSDEHAGRPIFNYEHDYSLNCTSSLGII